MHELIAALKKFKSTKGFHNFLSEFPDFIFLIDGQGTFLDWFAANENMLAVPSEKIIGKTLHELFPPALADQALKSVSEELASGKGIFFEYELPLNNSSSYFLARLVRQDGNKVAAAIKNITYQRTIEQQDAKYISALKESEQRFRLLAEHLPGAVYLCNNDPDYSMVYLNEKIFQITGYSPEEFLSKKINFPQIYHPEDAAKIYKAVNESLAHKTSFHLEYRIFHKSGELRWVEEFGTGVFSENQLTCLEGYLQDITLRKNTEAKILEQNEALSKTNEELDRFVYSASHDLRSPLSSLLGLIHLGEHAESVEETKMIFEKMNSRVRDLEHFIKEITYYSQNSRLELDETEFSLTNLVHEGIELHEHMKEAKGIAVSISPQEDFRLVADARRLKIILNNIISNAIKYSDSKKTEQWIKIRFEKNINECAISIADNGLGIHPQHHKKIFNMFYRASEQSSGSGLGLYIVKETLNKMKGRIEFHSVEGEGSIFTVILPMNLN